MSDSAAIGSSRGCCLNTICCTPESFRKMSMTSRVARMVFIGVVVGAAAFAIAAAVGLVVNASLVIGLVAAVIAPIAIALILSKAGKTEPKADADDVTKNFPGKLAKAKAQARTSGLNDNLKALLDKRIEYLKEQLATPDNSDAKASKRATGNRQRARWQEECDKLTKELAALS